MPISAAGTSYDIFGEDNSHNVVLIHGLGLNRNITWDNIVTDLQREFRVVTYDLCGHGETTLPDDEVTLDYLSNQLIELLDELEIGHATLIGFSLGGMINRRVAMDCGNRVASLVILNSPHEREDSQQRLAEERAIATDATGPFANIEASLTRWFTESFRCSRADVVDEVREIVLANDHANYAAHYRVLTYGVKELIRPAPAISHRTLIMTCENDTGSTPEMSKAIASEIVGSQTIIVPDLQHLGLIESPNLFAMPIISFIKS